MLCNEWKILSDVTMHIQTDLIEQQCERSGPTDYFTISPFPLSCWHFLLLLSHITHWILIIVVVVIWSVGSVVCFYDSALLSDATALKPGKKSENGFHMPTLSGSLSHSKPRPACSECHQRKLPNRQTEDVCWTFKGVLYYKRCFFFV